MWIVLGSRHRHRNLAEGSRNSQTEFPASRLPSHLHDAVLGAQLVGSRLGEHHDQCVDCILSCFPHPAPLIGSRLLLLMARVDFSQNFSATNTGNHTAGQGMVDVFAAACRSVQVPRSVLAQCRARQIGHSALQGNFASAPSAAA